MKKKEESSFLKFQVEHSEDSRLSWVKFVKELNQRFGRNKTPRMAGK